jgi:hypothetical protein
MIIAAALGAWVLLSVPVSLLVGKCISHGQTRETR